MHIYLKLSINSLRWQCNMIGGIKFSLADNDVCGLNHILEGTFGQFNVKALRNHIQHRQTDVQGLSQVHGALGLGVYRDLSGTAVLVGGEGHGQFRGPLLPEPSRINAGDDSPPD